MLACDRDLLLGGRSNLAAVSAILVQPRRMVQGVGHAECVANLTGQLIHLTVGLHGLIRKAQVPEGHRQVAAVGNAGIVARVGCPKFCALPVFELGHRRREAIAGTGEIRLIEHRLA